MAQTIAATQSHTTATDGMLHYNLAVHAGHKRKQQSHKAQTAEKEKTGKICNHPQNYTASGLDAVKQIPLQTEAKLHNVVSAPLNAEIIKRLRIHYSSCIHSHKPLGAASDAANTFYAAKFPTSILDHFAKKK